VGNRSCPSLTDTAATINEAEMPLAIELKFTPGTRHEMTLELSQSAGTGGHEPNSQVNLATLGEGKA